MHKFRPNSNKTRIWTLIKRIRPAGLFWGFTVCNENYSIIKTIILLKILEKSDLLDIQKSAITHCNPQEILAWPLEAQFVCRSNGYGSITIFTMSQKSTILTRYEMKIQSQAFWRQKNISFTKDWQFTLIFNKIFANFVKRLG